MAAQDGAGPSDMSAIDAALDRALDLEAEERRRFLDGLTPEERREVVGLLAAALREGPLDTPLVDVAGHLLELAGGEDPPDAEVYVGRHFGPWRALERLGAGGMGVVYLVERVGEGFEQRAALKVIRWELADSGLVGRFLAERQILAQLSHPHIASLIDGGVTEGGLPYLVLEYVEGEPVDRYISTRNLGLRRRLELAAKIIRAVDFAHRQLVVHRDLKPSNILVRADGVPKLVDFGVAKLLDEPAAEATRFAPITPSYASPEQRRGEAAGISSDIWSLGVVLAELISAERPEIKGDGVCLLTTGEPVPGDLVNIIARATEAEAERRYRSAGELADDIDRFLSGLPVRATAPTVRYRLGKWLKRHLAAVLIIAAVGMIGIAGVVWQALEARTERDQARLEAETSEQMSRFLLDLFRSSRPRLGEEPTVRSMLDRGAEQIRSNLLDAPRQRAEVLSNLAESYKWLGEHEKAMELYQEALDIERRLETGGRPHAAIVDAIGGVELFRGDVEAAEARFREALELLDRAGDAGSTHRASLMNSIAMCRQQVGDSQGSIELLESSVQLYVEAEDSTGLAMARGNLGLAYDGVGRLGDGEREHREAARLYRKYDPSNSTLLTLLNNLAGNLAKQGRLFDAMDMIEGALETYRSNSLPGPDLAIAEANLAHIFLGAGRSREALELARRASEVIESNAPGSRNAIATRANLGWALSLEQEHGEALAVLERVVAEMIERFGVDHAITARGRTRLGAALFRAGRLERAQQSLAAAVDHFRREGTSGRPVADVLLSFGALACDRGDGKRGLAEVEEALAFFEASAQGPSWSLELARIERERCLGAAGRPWSQPAVERAGEILEELRGDGAWGVRRAQELLSEKG